MIEHLFTLSILRTREKFVTCNSTNRQIEEVMFRALFSLFFLSTFVTFVMSSQNAKNVFGRALTLCGTKPMTGYYRDGYCRTDANDNGVHVVAAVLTQEFLDFSKSRGNDLITPRGSFPGLKPGDRWCLCALRWKEAFDEGKAPKVDLNATNEAVLKYVSLENLKSLSID
jgi:uncharacterized protein